MSDGPKSGPRRCIRTACVLVRVDVCNADADFDVHALCAVAAAIEALDVPGATVLRVSAQPHDGMSIGVQSETR